MANSLTIEKIDAAYGAVRVIEDVSLTVNAGETVVLLGTNGNGKSTLMKCIMGIVRAERRPHRGRDRRRAATTSSGLTTEQIVDLGIALVPEGRRLFPAPHGRGEPAARRLPPKARARDEAAIWTSASRCFPRLAERRSPARGLHERRRAADAGARRAR